MSLSRSTATSRRVWASASRAVAAMVSRAAVASSVAARGSVALPQRMTPRPHGGRRRPASGRRCRASPWRCSRGPPERRSEPSAPARARSSARAASDSMSSRRRLVAMPKAQAAALTTAQPAAMSGTRLQMTPPAPGSDQATPAMTQPTAARVATARRPGTERLKAATEYNTTGTANSLLPVNCRAGTEARQPTATTSATASGCRRRQSSGTTWRAIAGRTGRRPSRRHRWPAR